MDITLTNELLVSNIPNGLYSELTAKLQFINPKWLENERLGRWNKDTPKILKFYRKKGSHGLIIPRGYMRQLLLSARQLKESVSIQDKRRKLPEIELEFTAQLKPFQQEAVDVMLRKDFGTLSAPTGSGKTVMALNMIAKRRQPALIIVHTKDLAQQWVDRIETFLGIPKTQVGRIGGGINKRGEKITVALVQSLYKNATDISDAIGFVVVDECHRTPSRTFTEALTVFDATYMLGLSATPWRRDHLSKLIYWHLGDVHHKIGKADLVAEGHILAIDVVIRQTSFKPYYDPINEYSKMLSELTVNDDRNRMIVDDIAKEIACFKSNDACLVLSDRKHHCTTLQTLLKHRHHVDSGMLTGDVPIAQRNLIADELRKGHIRVLIATGQLVGEGFDCPNLSILFLTTPIRFSGRVMQYLGRILRPNENVERARVYDYVDIHVAPLVASARARQQVYALNAEEE